MNPICHLMFGSFLANARAYELRERRLVMAASLFPDLDGIFMPLDYVHKVAPGLQSISIFSGEFGNSLHHTFSHNVFSSVAAAFLLALLNQKRRLELFFMCSLSAVLQIFIDVITNDSSWPQQFFRPLTNYNFLLENFIPMRNPFLVKVVIIQYVLIGAVCAGTVWLYRRRGRTFLEFFSVRLDRLLTDFVTLPFSRKCALCGARAFYRSSKEGTPLCPAHALIHKNLVIEPRPQEKQEKQE